MDGDDLQRLQRWRYAHEKLGAAVRGLLLPVPAGSTAAKRFRGALHEVHLVMISSHLREDELDRDARELWGTIRSWLEPEDSSTPAAEEAERRVSLAVLDLYVWFALALAAERR